jgi:hypothetical protein
METTELLGRVRPNDLKANLIARPGITPVNKPRRLLG